MNANRWLLSVVMLTLAGAASAASSPAGHGSAASSPSSSPSSSTSAPAVRGQGWSLLSGETLGDGQNALAVSAGFPGISAEYLHGVSPHVDLGLRLTFNYGLEGLTTLIIPGLKLQAVSRLSLLDNGHVNLGLTVDPGVFTYFFQRSVNVGVTLPVGLVVGFPVSDALCVHAGLEVPLYLTFGLGSSLSVPVLMGGGLEYFLDKSLAVTLDVKMGPSLNTNFSRAQFAFSSLVGAAFKL